MLEHAVFMPMLKFTLVDKKERLFQARRLDYRAAGQKWKAHYQGAPFSIWQIGSFQTSMRMNFLKSCK